MADFVFVCRRSYDHSFDVVFRFVSTLSEFLHVSPDHHTCDISFMEIDGYREMEKSMRKIEKVFLKSKIIPLRINITIDRSGPTRGNEGIIYIHNINVRENGYSLKQRR